MAGVDAGPKYRFMSIFLSARRSAGTAVATPALPTAPTGWLVISMRSTGRSRWFPSIFPRPHDCPHRFRCGSPNGISPVAFVRLVDALTLHFAASSPVISIELDPRTFGAEWAAVIASVGITRASLGVQTFAPALQKAIGRVQPAAMIETGTTMLRNAGVTSINFDLMYGLPGQTFGDLRDSLDVPSRWGQTALHCSAMRMFRT